MSISINRYNSEQQAEWDNFIDASKNGTFILKRGYMDYHSDRFQDFSLMFYDDGKLLAVMPASLHGDEVRSHGGLTYGGIISDKKMTTPKMLEVFDVLKAFLKENGIKKLLYKRVPAIFYQYPSDEDMYALFRNNATIAYRNISTTILMEDKINFNERRRRNIKKAIKANLLVHQSFDFKGYINLVNEVLGVHHDAKAVHTGDELELLASRFPDNIKLFITENNEHEMLAGVLIYEMPMVAHTQYIANSDRGRDIGALDLVFDYLINNVYTTKKYFDFGTSNEENGKVLNFGLVGQKQEFGGRGIIYDIYELDI
ncbi:MAG: GNAT family N-acetyltransferase [Alphaproteobacteria bacterium]|nr:GNAT family N-acetyltransferase [Alphaproteobacteria bacterium]